MDTGTGEVIAALFLTAPGLTALIVTLRGRARSRRDAQAAIQAAKDAKEAAELSKAEIVAVGDKVFQVGKAIDGRLTELLASREAGALARGRLEGEATEKARASEKADNLREGRSTGG